MRDVGAVVIAAFQVLRTFHSRLPASCWERGVLRGQVEGFEFHCYFVLQAPVAVGAEPEAAWSSWRDTCW